MRREARAKPTQVEHVPVRGTQTFGEDWEAAELIEERRAVLDDAVESILISRGRPGRRTADSVLARLTFTWKMPDDLGPIEAPDDETLAEWAI